MMNANCDRPLTSDESQPGLNANTNVQPETQTNTNTNTNPIPPVFVAVAVPVPFLDLLTYRVPDGVDPPVRGARVLVPLGTRQVAGCVVTVDVDVPSGVETRDLIRVIDAGAYRPAARRGSRIVGRGYYAAGPGEAISAAMPPGAVQLAPRRAHAFRTIRVASLTVAGHDFAQRGADSGLRLTDRHRDALAVLQGVPMGLPVSQLKSRGISGDMLRRLAIRGLVSFRQDPLERDPFATMEPGAESVETSREPRILSAEQAVALAELERLAAARAFHVALLHGVTGSGKTEIYLRLADSVVSSGRRVLVLVPEIALTPAVASAFRRSFGQRVAIQHSGLSDGERHDQWHRIREGLVDVVVGTRSAVFGPLDKVGLIIVDEEHDLRTSRRRRHATTGATSPLSEDAPPGRLSCSGRRRRRWRATGMRWMAAMRCSR